LRLLVLRPEPDASETAARLRALGHSVLIAPMLNVEFRPEPAGLPEPAAILFTSRNAVRALDRWRQAAGWRHCPAFAVGEETASLARAAGFSDVRAGDRDAAALADLVAATLPPERGTLLYPAARDRAGDLERRLTGLGLEVRAVEAYRAVAAEELGEATATALRNGAIEGVLVYSRRTAATFRDLAQKAGLDHLPHVTFYALSESVAELVVAFRPAEIRIAARADAMLALLSATH
jgi:uroporphyrinogen-III synthase